VPAVDGGGERDRGVVVLGVGNVLMGDDALGPAIIKHLEAAYDFPEGVSVYDAGTPGLDLTPYIADAHALIVVDTVEAKGQGGELRQYRRDAILKYAPLPRLNPHEPGLKEALLTLEFSGGGPGEVLLVGVIPQSVEPGVGLSPQVAAAVPAVIEAVTAELARLERPLHTKDAPGAPDLWWEEEVRDGS
jgi:hydrogenase maturation protease